jgi:predicted methyltransferase
MAPQTLLETCLMSRMTAAWFMLALLWPLAAPAEDDVSVLLDQALAGDHRAEANRARDVYRHPKETLMFFGLRPGLAVVEIWPSAGWFTEVIAPVLRGRGRFYAARFAVSSDKAPPVLKERDKAFLARMATRPDVYDEVIPTEILAPDHLNAAPAGSADLVLTFRNVHNWAKSGTAEAMFRAFFDLLKSGGVLGVEEHRAVPGTPFEEQVRTGYMTEEYVIETARQAGFRFMGKSEINANPRDTKDHPAGVWTLPPTLRLGEQDRERYLAIGESDRMTIKFIKP